VRREVGVSTLTRVNLTGDELGSALEMGGGSVAGTGVAGMGSGGAVGAAVAGPGSGRAAGVVGAVGVAVCSLTCGINNSSPSSWADNPK
jgi:hypothetical protein